MKQVYLNESSAQDNGTINQLKQLKFDYSRIAIISVHGDPGNFLELKEIEYLDC